MTFVTEYVVDGNATRAAVCAGYSEKTAYSIGSQLLKHPDVRSEIDKRQDAKAREASITIPEIIGGLRSEDPYATSAARVGAYRLLGVHMGMFDPMGNTHDNMKRKSEPTAWDFLNKLHSMNEEEKAKSAEEIVVEPESDKPLLDLQAMDDSPPTTDSDAGDKSVVREVVNERGKVAEGGMLLRKKMRRRKGGNDRLKPSQIKIKHHH